MNCPVCSVTLHIANREGVEIDFCPKCRGIWLDRGELDKLIERSSSARHGAVDHDDDDDDNGEFPAQGRRADQTPSPKGGYTKKRESFWSQIFDFD